MTSKVKKSDVWDFFTKKTDTDKNNATCNLCGQNYKMGGGTTNLKNHLMHKHAPVIGENLRLRCNNNQKGKTKYNLDSFCTSQTKRQKIATVSDSTETDTEEEESNLIGRKDKELIQVSQ